MSQAGPLALRCFAEGLEIPVVSAQVQIAPGQPALASIQIVPTDSALLFLPRTFITLFYLDSLLGQGERALLDQLADEGRVGAFDAEDSRYRLLYAGEVTGLNYAKSPQSRSVVLQCMDLSSYWDTCYQWFMDYSGHGFLDKTHNFVGAGEYLFDNIASGTRWVLGNILGSRPENPLYANCRGLLGGYIHMLESVGGISPRATKYQAYRGVNDFFTIAELRYRLTGQLGAIPKDVSSARLYKRSAFQSWLRSGMGSAGSLVSFRDLLRVVGQYIFHQTYPNPAAMLYRGGDEVSIRTRRFETWSELDEAVDRDLRDLKDRFADASRAFRSISNGSIAKDDGRNVLIEGLRSLADIKERSGALDITGKAAYNSRLDSAQQNIAQALARLTAITGGSNLEDFDRVGSEQGQGVANRITAAIIAIEGAVNNTTWPRAVPQRRTDVTSDHLFSQLILPETFFVPPPTCNVLFPDSYTSLQYSRNFMREVSRLSVQGGLGIIAGGSRGANILGNYYFAPNIPDVSGRLAEAEIYKQGTTILPHELHSGIIPKFEWVTDGHRWATKDLRRGERQKERKIRYIQRLANHQFLLHRWGARQLTVQAHFNPNLVLGFPGVVLDRTAPAPSALESIADALGSGWAVLPTAYVGKIEQIVHNVNQDGGTTSVVYGKARTHKGFDDEYLGIVDRERRDLEDQEIVVSPAALVSEAANGALTSRREALILRAYMAGTLIDNRSLDAEVISAGEPTLSDEGVTMSRAQLASVGIPTSVFDAYANRSLGTPFVGESVLDPADPSQDTLVLPEVITAPVRVRTQLGRYVTPEDGRRPEVVLKPDWYSDVWAPENVGRDVYQVLLGCASIIDASPASTAEEYEDIIRAYVREEGISPEDIEVERTAGPGGTVLGTAKVRGRTVATLVLEAPPSVEHAIDVLTMQYSLLKRQQSSAGAFIRAFTARPIATLPEVLGSRNLAYDADGNVVPAGAGEEDPIEGFFSRSFGDYNVGVSFSGQRSLNNRAVEEPTAGEGALNLLFDDDSQYQSYAKSIFDKGGTIKNAQGSKILVPRYLDPRGRARQRVRAYRAELLGSRGLAGV